MASFKLSILFALITALISVAQASFSFQSRIPNGNQVPDPCQSGAIWSGVGHQSTYGSNTLNPFGQDFKSAGNRWTLNLCQMDSDKDGLTNGQELGDPSCVWTVGATPARTTGLSHPGICPIYSTTCSNAWNACPNLPNPTLAPPISSNTSVPLPPSQTSTQASSLASSGVSSNKKSNQVLIISIVCTCLGFILALVALHVLANFLHSRLACYKLSVESGPKPEPLHAVNENRAYAPDRKDFNSSYSTVV